MPTASSPWPAIGAGFARSRATLGLALAVGLAAVTRDLLEAPKAEGFLPRGAPVALAILVFAVLARRDLRSLGFRATPEPSVRWWARATLVVGLGMGALFVVVVLAWHAFVGEIRVPRLFHARSDVLPFLVQACLVAPVVEESVYRLALCAPLAPLIGRVGTVVVGGFVFAFLHVRYGHPSLDNQVAGFVLTWAYLRSGTLWVPIALHALGNLCVAIFHVGLLYGWPPLPWLRAA